MGPSRRQLRHRPAGPARLRCPCPLTAVSTLKCSRDRYRSITTFSFPMAAVAEEQEREKEEKEEEYQENDEEKDQADGEEKKSGPHMRSSAPGRSWQLRALPRSARSRCAPGALRLSPSRDQNRNAARFCSELSGTPVRLSPPQGGFLARPCSCQDPFP